LARACNRSDRATTFPAPSRRTHALRLKLLRIVDAESKSPAIANDLLSFFADRLKVQLREQGARHDLVDAVLAQHGEGSDDLVLIVRRVEALGKFLAPTTARACSPA